MVMKKVAILMSTYNGREYIKEQIESIYAQDYPKLQLYIRDDGSKPEFVQLLEELQKEYGFVLYKGDNLGFLKSFFWLLKQVGDAHYYAFADQDDIWNSSKISKALSWLTAQEEETTVPLLYHCAYEVRNENDELMRYFYYDESGYDFRRSLTENHYSGFAMVVNQSMRSYMLRADVDQIDYHDWWAANIAQGIGKTYFDTYIGAVHRAHRENVTKITFARKIAWFVATLKEESAIHKRAKECSRVFYEELTDENQKVLKLFLSEKYHIVNACKKAFYPKRWRPVLSSEIAMRILMLLGKV